MIVNEKLNTGSIRRVWYSGQNKEEFGLTGWTIPYRINKPWGYELIHQNHHLYCCKLIHINPYSSCSMHLHLEKHETLVVTKGILYIDTIINKERDTYSVEPGQAFVIAPGFIHSLRAYKKEVELIESSTPSYDTDSIRIEDGQNGKQ